MIFLSLALLASFSGARAQENSHGSYDIVTRPGSALLEVQSALWWPVWCDAHTIAFQREVEAGARRIVEYHTLGAATFRTENLIEGGGLVACSRGGAERVMRRGGTDGDTGEFFLVETSDRREIELTATAWMRLMSTDHLLRNYTFESESPIGGGFTNFELVTLEKARDGDFPEAPPRRTMISAPQYAVIHRAALSADGGTLAYATRAMYHSGARRDGPPLELFLLQIGQSKARRVLTGDVIDEDTRLDSLFFDGNRLVLGGTSTTKELVIAICSTDHPTSVLCRLQPTGLDATEFEIASLTSKGLPMIVSRVQILGQNGLRACLFEFSEANRGAAPPTCRASVPPKPTYGMEPEQFYSIAPDRRHVAVRTRYRSSQDSPLPDQSTWVVVPLSEFQIN